MFGGVVFAHMAWVLVYLSHDTGQPSMEVGTYILLSMVEVFTCMRAGADVNEVSNNNSIAGGGNRLVTTIVPDETLRNGSSATSESDKERSGRAGSIPDLANGSGADPGDHHNSWQLSLFERDEIRQTH